MSDERYIRSDLPVPQGGFRPRNERDLMVDFFYIYFSMGYAMAEPLSYKEKNVNAISRKPNTIANTTARKLMSIPMISPHSDGIKAIIITPVTMPAKIFITGVTMPRTFGGA